MRAGMGVGGWELNTGEADRLCGRMLLLLLLLLFSQYHNHQLSANFLRTNSHFFFSMSEFSETIIISSQRFLVKNILKETLF